MLLKSTIEMSIVAVVVGMLWAVIRPGRGRNVEAR